MCDHDVKPDIPDDTLFASADVMNLEDEEDVKPSLAELRSQQAGPSRERSETGSDVIEGLSEATRFFESLPRISYIHVQPPQCSTCHDDLFHTSRSLMHSSALDSDDFERRTKFSNDQEIVAPPCGHTYHQGCLEMWIIMCENNDVSPTCPGCRLPFEREEMVKLQFGAGEDIYGEQQEQSDGLGIPRFIHSDSRAVKEILQLAREVQEVTGAIQRERLTKGLEGANEDADLEATKERLCKETKHFLRSVGDKSRRTHEREKRERLETLDQLMSKLKEQLANTVLRNDMARFGVVTKAYMSDLDRVATLVSHNGQIRHDCLEMQQAIDLLQSQIDKLHTDRDEAGEVMRKEIALARAKEAARWHDELRFERMEIDTLKVAHQRAKTDWARDREVMLSTQRALDDAKEQIRTLTNQLLTGQNKLLRSEKKRQQEKDENYRLKKEIRQLKEAGLTFDFHPDHGVHQSRSSSTRKSNNTRHSKPSDPDSPHTTMQRSGDEDDYTQVQEDGESSRRIKTTHGHPTLREIRINTSSSAVDISKYSEVGPSSLFKQTVSSPVATKPRNPFAVSKQVEAERRAKRQRIEITTAQESTKRTGHRSLASGRPRSTQKVHGIVASQARSEVIDISSEDDVKVLSLKSGPRHRAAIANKPKAQTTLSSGMLAVGPKLRKKAL